MWIKQKKIVNECLDHHELPVSDDPVPVVVGHVEHLVDLDLADGHRQVLHDVPELYLGEVVLLLLEFLSLSLTFQTLFPHSQK